MVGEMETVYVIAEAGVNHNGCIHRAKRMVEVAAESGANAIKFQTFTAEKLLTPNAPKADYQLQSTDCNESQFEMIRSLELSDEAHRALIAQCRECNIEFMSSAFDIEGLAYLYDLGMRTFKIPSGEITNLPYLRAIGKLASEALVSTGMASIEEVQASVNVIEDAGVGRDRIFVLQCHTEYPTKIEDVNLRAMEQMGKMLGVKYGYSDHTVGHEVALAATALGASVIEKHFTLDRELPGPDHKASIEPNQLREMILGIRKVEAALGSSCKQPTPVELKNREIVRKSIFAAESIKRGDEITEASVSIKRPGTGLSPMHWDQVIGSTARKDFRKHDPIEL